MFLLASLLVLGVVALGPQVVLGSFKFNLSPVVQCEPVNLTFSGSGSNNHSIPTTLTILPLLDNVPPIRIAIPNGASNSTGIQLTFIPLPADTDFIASLDDLQGTSAQVSDVTRVNAPVNGAPSVTTCFGNIPQSNFYQFDDVLNQCENFSINFTTPTAPNITSFSPRGTATWVTANVDPNAPPGTASYTMNGQREAEIVLLFDDGQGHLQTTKLITIGGDSSSSSSCLNKGKSTSADNDSGPSKTKVASGLPKAAIIGIAVGASIVGLLAILLLLYYLRARRRRQRASDMSFDPALLNRRWPPDEKKFDLSPPPPFTAPPPFSGGNYVRDPIYTDEKYTASIMSDARTSIGSWDQFIPDDQRSQRTQSFMFGQRPISSASTLSMNTADIHNILQMATVHTDRSSVGEATVQGRTTPQPSTAGTAMTFNVAKPAVARLVSTRRRMSGDPPDMPVSAVSRNNSASAAAIAGVPTGYGPYGPSSYMSFGDSDDESVPATIGHSDGSGGVDGIGGFPIPPVKRPSNPRDTSESWGDMVAP